MLEPALATMHNRRVLTSMGLLELTVPRWSSLDPDVRDLAELAVSTQIGCSWCIDFGYFLSRNLIPFEWLDAEQSDAARGLMAERGIDVSELPALLFPDGAVLKKPSHQAVAEKIGLRTHAELPFYDLIIVGAGPAGLAAAVYGSSEGLRTLVIEREAPGGQAGTSSRIENYLGFPAGLSGADLARRGVAQAHRLRHRAADFRYREHQRRHLVARQPTARNAL